MGIYILNLVLVLFWGLLINISHISNKKLVFTLIVSFQLFLILFLRSEAVGTDVASYLNLFDSVAYSNYQMLSSLRHEIGYLIFTKIITLITLNHRIFLGIIAAITVFSISYIIFKHSKVPILSFYLYITLGFYAFTFSGLRQAIAYSIIFFSYKFIKEKSFIKFLVVVLIATLFHKSAFVFIVAYFIAYKRITTRYLIFYFLSFIVIFIFRMDIMRIVIKYFYEDYDVYDSGAYTILLVTLVVLVFLLIFHKNVLRNDKYAVINYNLVMFSLLLIALASTSSNVLRMADYFYYFIILLVPEVIVSFKDKNLKILAYFFVLILTFLQYIYLTPSSFLNVVPYEFFWQ